MGISDRLDVKFRVELSQAHLDQLVPRFMI